MSNFVIKTKDGSGWVQGLVKNKNNKNKRIIVVTTNQNEAQAFPSRRDAKNLLRKHRFATSNYEIELIEDGKSMEYKSHKEYGDE